MVLGDEILKILNKQYEPGQFINMKFKRYDIGFKTDEAGRPILVFIGQLDENGKIKGERFARRLILNEQGDIVKDHWDNKGKTN
jgi:coenzyme F420-reducing hydrogenase alpha subunit